MYIHPFLAGVLATVFTELAALLVLALIKVGGKKR